MATNKINKGNLKIDWRKRKEAKEIREIAMEKIQKNKEQVLKKIIWEVNTEWVSYKN